MTESSIANTAQQEFWNTVAGPRWVGLGGIVERRVRAVNDLLLARSAVTAGESVLEIGCGTGAATVPFAEAVGERGRVVGVDISEPMLAGARKRIAESGLGNVSLLQADAQVHRLRARPVRPDHLALRRHVLCRSGRGLQPISCRRRDPTDGCVSSAGRHSRKTGTG